MNRVTDKGFSLYKLTFAVPVIPFAFMPVILHAREPMDILMGICFIEVIIMAILYFLIAKNEKNEKDQLK